MKLNGHLKPLALPSFNVSKQLTPLRLVENGINKGVCASRVDVGENRCWGKPTCGAGGAGEKEPQR
jgi:hypothetical protein